MDLESYARPFSFSTSSQVGVLVLHGFTSTPSSVLPLGEGLARAGYNVEGPCLSGHGRTWVELGRTKLEEWRADAEKAYQELKSRSGTVFAAGLSMGGALALDLAQRHPELAGTILINHALFLMPDWRLPLLPVMKHLVPSVGGVGGDIKDPQAVERTYDRTPTRAVHELIKLMGMVRAGLAKVNQPCLIMKSKEDHVIPAKSATYTLERISSDHKRLVWLPNSYHVATLDYDRELIIRETVRFIRDVAGTEGEGEGQEG